MDKKYISSFQKLPLLQWHAHQWQNFRHRHHQRQCAVYNAADKVTENEGTLKILQSRCIIVFARQFYTGWTPFKWRLQPQNNIRQWCNWSIINRRKQLTPVMGRWSLSNFHAKSYILQTIWFKSLSEISSHFKSHLIPKSQTFFRLKSQIISQLIKFPNSLNQ